MCLTFSASETKLHTQQRSTPSFLHFLFVPVQEGSHLLCYQMLWLGFDAVSSEVNGSFVFNCDRAALYPFHTCALQEKPVMSLRGYCAWSIVAALLFTLSLLCIHSGFSLAMFQTPHPNPQAFDN